MTVRRAIPADTPALRAMMAGSNGYERAEARAMIVAFAGGWSVPDDGHEVWVAEDDGAVAGFYALIPHGADQELDLFFTANDSQGTGLGRRLLEHMAARARALGATRVVISSNPEAAGFYRRMGAVDIGVSPPGDGISWERPKFELYL
ncbi:MAG: GNAT family N-acetyltransferase [Caulobacterales bacterium]|nr:GNAT family N-acetyltransferase [Caulobacterales bacterium]